MLNEINKGMHETLSVSSTKYFIVCDVRTYVHAYVFMHVSEGVPQSICRDQRTADIVLDAHLGWARVAGLGFCLHLLSRSRHAGIACMSCPACLCECLRDWSRTASSSPTEPSLQPSVMFS